MTRRRTIAEPTMAIVVLAGGRSHRMGRDKLSLRQGDRTLLQVILDQLAPFSIAPLRLAGPKRDEITGDFMWVGEQPPGGGPVAGIKTALEGVEAEWTVLMAGDAPKGPLAVPALLSHRVRLAAGQDGVIVVDARGKRQPLCAMYRTTSLSLALEQLGEATGASMRQLLENLTLVDLPDTWEAAGDIDTASDAERAGFA